MKSGSELSRSESVEVHRAQPLICVIDDDVSVRESLELLLQSQGWCVELCSSAEAFFQRNRTEVPRCLLLDIALPGPSGLDLQEGIAREYPATPIVFITGYGSIPMTVRAMKRGAFEFLTKPLCATEVLAAIRAALDKSRMLLSREASQQALRLRYQSLTLREREVMALVVSGMANKQVAAQLGVSEITVKRHRGRTMQKMNAASLPDLVKMSGRLRLRSLAVRDEREPRMAQSMPSLSL